MIYLIIQQKQILRIFHTLILPSFALKTNLASLKTEVDKLDINRLVPIPVDLSQLSDVVKNDVVKETVYNRLVAKVNAVPSINIDTKDFVLKTTTLTKQN